MTLRTPRNHLLTLCEGFLTGDHGGAGSHMHVFGVCTLEDYNKKKKGKPVYVTTGTCGSWKTKASNEVSLQDW